MGRRPKIQQENIPPKITKNTKIKTPSLLRGVRDILPNEQIYWSFLRKKIELIAKKYDYQRIDTPILEEKILFQRAIGKHNETVLKELFCFADQSGSNVCLRPEGTAPIARAYIKHGMYTLPQPVKLYYEGPMFRYDRPQSGRHRQFHQTGFEVIGDNNPILDAQLILIAVNFFSELNIKVNLQINSIGCEVCRSNYTRELGKFLKTKKSRLCNECKKRLTINPLKVLNCREKGCQGIREEAPQIIDWLCEGCKKHFVKVLEYLDEIDISYDLNPYMIRCLDYYSHTVFEIWPEDDTQKENAQNDLAGGGRYNDLITMLGGKPTPAVGFAIGLERAILQMKKQNFYLPPAQWPIVFLAQLGDQAKRKSLKLFEELHRQNIFAIESLSEDSLKAQLDLANKHKVKFVLILGQKEVIDNTILLRDMEGGMQEVIDFKKIIPELKKKIEEILTDKK